MYIILIYSQRKQSSINERVTQWASAKGQVEETKLKLLREEHDLRLKLIKERHDLEI